jgi:hypothetical protein
VPEAISSTAINMTAATGTTANGTVQYLFTETSGNPGGSSSGWQNSPSYTDSGLTASTRYTYTVTMRDALANTVNAFVPTAAMSAITNISGFSKWQSANATAQNIDLDHDTDGVPNGIEFFLGGGTNTSGPTTLPGISKNNGVLSITWGKSATYSGIYGIDYWVETSNTLTGVWTPETLGGNVTVSGNEVKYTYPTPLGIRKFTRLRVTGP